MSETPSHHGVAEKSTSTYPNETIRLLLERASCRTFTEQKIAPDVQELLFRAATHAPTGGNLQPFSIIAVEDKTRAERLCEYSGGQRFVAEAPLNLVFCIDWHRIRRWAELESAPFTAANSFRHFWISFQDTVMAAQNLCTAADALGLGCVYVGTIMEYFREVRALCVLPEQVFPVVLLSIGYPTAYPAPRKKLDPSVIVHREKYRDLPDSELLEAFNRKYPEVKIELTPERIEQYTKVCRTVHGNAFADESLTRIREKGFFNAAQRYFGLHYAADAMPLQNCQFLESFSEFGLNCFKEYTPANGKL